MKKIKIVLIISILLSFLVVGINFNKEVNASGLVVMKNHNGNDMTYRNSSEKVMQLEEYNYPTSQLRATWVSMFVSDLPKYSTKEKFISNATALLDNVESMGMNAIVYHLRTHNNAMYKSELNPLATWYSGVDFDVFDPTAWLIDECHKRGIEFHAWLNPYRISTNGSVDHYVSGSTPSVNPAHDSSNFITVGNNIILDPGIPSNRDFIIDTCMEIVENYDVDAIHFDDYFYIDGSEDSATRAKYNTTNLSVGDFRRKQVDLFIEGLSNELRAYNSENNKTVQLGISPSGIYRNGGYSASPNYDANGNLTSPINSNTSGFAHYDDYLYSDTLNWINNEWIDYIMPQTYWATEHTSASYVELTKWWSWAVRYKKVNFYTGMGIYMAVGTGSSAQYWQYNTNEIEKQLLNAGQYAEFDGACFYKYSTLKETSNAVVNHAVNLISNDYWAKRVPAAVQKYYAPLMDEVSPSNIRFDKATNTISYSAVENVRGYMIYQVPKGETLDKNNINHVHSYIQETSVKVTDITNYDYYVASVNLANETSVAEIVNVNLSAQNVIDAIAALPTNLTLNDKATVEGVRKLYESLDGIEQAKVTNLNVLIACENKLIELNTQSVIDAIDNLPKNVSNTDKELIDNVRSLYEALPNTEKAKVHNLQKLIDAENALIDLNTYVAKLEAFINSLDLHIKTNRVIQTPENIIINYKNSSDGEIYNIVTGEKYKNYLATKYITLVATLNENGTTVSKEFDINVGYVASNQVGLFYRNDASCMSPDDEGSYTPGQSGYIGWSGHTITVDNNVLFIAENNYIEITDPTNIVGCNWVSVAGAYVNKTSSNVSMTLGQAFKNNGGGDGYFIISNNKIKSVSSEWDTTISITIAPDEVLVMMRYLDHQINNSIMSSMSTLYVGQLAYLDERNTKTPEDLAKEVIKLINTIPTTITLNDEALINSVNAAYNNLSVEAQALVSNAANLTNAINKLTELKEALNTYKQNKINELTNYLDKSLYETPQVTQINNILSNAITTINNAISIEEVDSIVSSTKESLDAVETKEEVDFKYTKQNAIEEIEGYVKLSDYPIDKQSTITNYINNAKTTINNATTIDEINNALNNAKSLIDKVSTLKQEQDLYIAKIDELIASYTDISEAERIEITKMGESFKEQIRNAVREVHYIWTRAVGTIGEYFENLEASRVKMSNHIDDYISKLDYVTKEIEQITILANNKKAYIYEIANIEVILTVFDEFVKTITELHDNLETAKTTAEAKLNALVQPWYTNSQKTYITEVVTSVLVEIKEAGLLNDVITLQNTTVDNVNTYIEQIEKAISDAITYITSKQDTSNKDLTSLINKTKTQITNAKTVSEVESLLKTFDSEYEALTNKPVKYTITFNVNGGTGSYNNIEVELNQQANLPTPTRPGYTFLGWYNGETKVESGKWIYEVNVTLVAKWEENKPIVDNLLIDAIKDSKEIVNKVNIKTDKAQQLVDDTLKALDKAISVDEVNDIMNHFNANINDYNKKNCKNSTFIYINLFLTSIAIIALFRKKH